MAELTVLEEKLAEVARPGPGGEGRHRLRQSRSLTSDGADLSTTLRAHAR